jgi:hypothetical protein
MGSPAMRAVPAYDNLPCFRSSGERPVRWDVAASVGDWKTAWGARLSPVKGVGAGRVEAQWRLRAPSGTLAQGRRVRGVKGCCGRGESKREAADGGAHRCGALGRGEAEATWNRAVRASARKRKPLGLGFY